MPLEEEDEEMKAYRKKIEEQKKIREKLIQQKEERRAQAAKSLQEAKQMAQMSRKEEIPVITNVGGLSNLEMANKRQPNLTRVNKNVVPVKIIDNVPGPRQNLGIVRTVTNVPTVTKVPFKADSDNPFMKNRIVYDKDASLPDTSIVIVKNLSRGTPEAKLRKMCQGIGDIQVRFVVDNLQ